MFWGYALTRVTCNLWSSRRKASLSHPGLLTLFSPHCRIWWQQLICVPASCYIMSKSTMIFIVPCWSGRGLCMATVSILPSHVTYSLTRSFARHVIHDVSPRSSPPLACHVPSHVTSPPVPCTAASCCPAVSGGGQSKRANSTLPS